MKSCCLNCFGRLLPVVSSLTLHLVPTVEARNAVKRPHFQYPLVFKIFQVCTLLTTAFRASNMSSFFNFLLSCVIVVNQCYRKSFFSLPLVERTPIHEVFWQPWTFRWLLITGAFVVCPPLGWILGGANNEFMARQIFYTINIPSYFVS